MITLRQLPVEEWQRLGVAYEACRSSDPLPLPKTEQGIIIAAEHEGKLIGCVGAERAWNVSPMWIDQEFRGNGLARKLAQEIKKHNAENLAELLVTTNPHVDLLVFQLGFIPVEGRLWRRK